MTWKIGCLTSILGLLLTFGSCTMLGTAARKAVDERQVANIPVEVGGWDELRATKVDPEGNVRIMVRTEVEIRTEVVDKERSSAEILRFGLPVSYEILTPEGAIVHLGAGTIRCSTIVPESSSSHFDSFDRRVSCLHHSERFQVPGGEMVVRIEVPVEAEEGSPIRSASVEVYDQLSRSVGSWVTGGVLSFFGGPFVIFVGFVLFVIGLLRAAPNRPPSSRA